MRGMWGSIYIRTCQSVTNPRAVALKHGMFLSILDSLQHCTATKRTVVALAARLEKALPRWALDQYDSVRGSTGRISQVPTISAWRCDQTSECCSIAWPGIRLALLSSAMPGYSCPWGRKGPSVCWLLVSYWRYNQTSQRSVMLLLST